MRLLAIGTIENDEGVDIEVGEVEVDVDVVEAGEEVDKVSFSAGRWVLAMALREGSRTRALASTSPMSTPPSWVKRIESPSRLEVMQT